jgi:hypothetical protein
MTAGVLQGAPVVTFDLDIVYSREPENLTRLRAALEAAEAIFRGDPRRLAPNMSHLESSGHKLLSTKFGDLDVLATLDPESGYQELLHDTVELSVGDLVLRALSLERLIAAKQKAGREKDLAVLPILMTTLEQSLRRK